MTLWKRIALSMVALHAGGLLAIGAHAQAPATRTTEVVAVTGRVDAIDRSSRSLTVRTTDGLAHTAYIGRELKVFDELKTGDTVTVRIAESIIVAVRPNAKLAAPADTTAAAQKESGDRADVLQQLKTVVRIEKVDRAANIVEYTTADGRRVVRGVADPGLLKGIEPGNVIEITFTRARAIELEKR